MTPASAAVRVLAPISLETFFAEIYEREPLYVPRKGTHSFIDVFSSAELDNVLIVGARNPERFALVRADGDEIASDAFTTLVPPPRPRGTSRGAERVLDVHAINARVKAGYTLVVKDASGFSAPLARFCDALGSDLGCYVQANAYLTPPGGHGLRAHHDTHDTLTLQIEGEKEWTIYDPLIALPLETQHLAGGIPASAIMHARVHLAAGDSLYLPRGFPHEARGQQTRSLHVTFALVPVRAVDVLEELVRVVAESDLELRRALRDGAHDQDLVARFVSKCSPEAIVAARTRALAAMQRSRRDARLL
jgi:hypothetical protein